MRNVPTWVARVEAAIARGRAAYKEAAELIIAAIRDNPGLTQKQVAEHIGHKPPWVCGLLKWYREGCPEGGVFGREIAARRARSKQPISTSKSGTLDIGPDRPWLSAGGYVIEGGPTDAPPYDESEATRKALATVESSRRLLKNLASLSRADMIMVYGWDKSQSRTTLQKLASGLDRSIAASQGTVAGARSALTALRFDAPA